MIKEDGKCDEAIKRRIGIAKGTFAKKNTVLTSGRVRTGTRKKEVQCQVWSTLIYGVETWTLTKDALRRLEVFEMWSYRRMLCIPWTTKKTNTEVLQMMRNSKKIIGDVNARKAAYFGHVARENNTLMGKINGRRSRGRQRQ